MRRNPWEWESEGFFDSLSFVPAEQKEALTRWAREYRQLADEIDRLYESDQAFLAADLEARAEFLLHRIEAAVDEVTTGEEEGGGPHGDDEPDPFEGEVDSEDNNRAGPGLEEELALLWQQWLDRDCRFDVIPHHDHPNGIFTREQQFARIARHVVLNRLHAAGGELAVRGAVPDLKAVTDAQILEAAREAWRQRRAAIERHRAAGRRFHDPREILRRAREARERRPGGMGPSR